MKIQNKISITFFITASVIFLAVGIFVYLYSAQMIKSDAESYLFSSAKARAENVRTFLQDQIALGKVMAASTVYRDFLLEPKNIALKDRVKKRLQRTLAGDRNFNKLFILDKDGQVIASSDPEEEGKDKSVDDYFLGSQDNVFVKDVHFSKLTNKTVFIISVPIKDDNTGETIGISVAQYSTEKFYSIVSGENGLGETEENFLINKDKFFLTPSRFLGEGVILTQKVETENSGQCFNEHEVEDVIKNGYGSLKEHQAEEGHTPIVQAQDYRGVDILGTHFYIPETGWCLITKVDRESIYQTSRNLSLLLLIIFVGSLIVLILVSYFISRKIIRPLIKLKEDAKIITQGDLDHKVEIISDDEIGDLSGIFGQMITEIKKSRAEVDKQVVEQTREIQNRAKDLADQQKAILNILEDVEGEKNKAEGMAVDLEKFKLAVDNASDHIVITDPEGIVLYGNNMVEKITGYTLEEALGKKAGFLWKKPMSHEYYEKLWKIIKKDKKPFVGQVTNIRKNGEEYEASISIAPVLNNKQHVIYFVGIERDVTKEKEIDKAKTEFVSLASHQLRTPLSTINWYTEMLLNGDAGRLKPEQANYLDEIYRGNQRMVDLVNALLNVSRLELGTFVVEPKDADIIKIAEVAIDELSPKIGERKIKFSKKYSKGVGKMKLDEKLTMIIFQNLLSNAVKYTPEKGSVSLEIKKGIEGVEIIVSDTGMGIPQSQQDKIFTKLFRADNVRETDTEGTGLGLYIIKQIVDHSGGKIWFKSIENKGTTFHVSIPKAGMKKKDGTRELGD